MKVWNPEGEIGPVDLSREQAEEVVRRVGAEVPLTPEIRSSFVEEERGGNRVGLSLVPPVANVGVRYTESDNPQFPPAVRAQVEKIMDEVKKAA